MKNGSDFLYSWHTPDEVLEYIPVNAEQRGLSHFADAKELREAWVLANFCQSFFVDKPPKLRLVQDQFPDGQVMLEGVNIAEEYEITDAFEGGTGHPDKESRIHGKVVDGKLTGIDWNSDTLKATIRSATQASLAKKSARNYTLKCHLLIYLRDLPTYGLVCLEDALPDSCASFSSINLLSSDALKAVRLFPKQVFRAAG